MALPSLFISHGAPDIVLQDLPATRFLRDLGRRLPRPQAIVVASAHWTTRALAVEIGARPPTIHDFGGFAPELHRMRYPAPGNPELGRRIVERFDGAGLVAGGSERGFDHGVWVPLSLMFPEANIPVIAVSVQPHQDGQHHLAVGRALAPLRDEGVLIIGSGAATHNLGALRPGSTTPPPWVVEFDDWLVDRVEDGDEEALADWTAAPGAFENHPSPEHFLPALVAAGAGGGRGRALHRSTTWGVLQMTMLVFGDETA